MIQVFEKFLVNFICFQMWVLKFGSLFFFVLFPELIFVNFELGISLTWMR